MAKKDKMIEALNASTKPYNLQVIVGAPRLDKVTGAPVEYQVTVNLTIMDEPKQIDGRTVQPTYRTVSTSGIGETIDDAKKNALSEALSYAGVI